MKTNNKIGIISWNISGNDLPANAQINIDLETKWELIAQEMKSNSPKILALQEIPMPELAVVYAEQMDLVAVEAIQTHEGYTALAIPKIWKDKIQHIVKTGAAVGCTIKMEDELWAIISIHLAPSKNMAPIRFAQLKNVVELINSRCDRVIIAGDTNMRKSENSSISGLGLQDAYYLSNSPKEHRWTWDSYKNPYHANSYAFTVRFDKILLKQWHVNSFQLIGTKPIEKGVYLSDHFGIFSELTLE